MDVAPFFTAVINLSTFFIDRCERKERAKRTRMTEDEYFDLIELKSALCVFRKELMSGLKNKKPEKAKAKVKKKTTTSNVSARVPA